MTHTVETLGLDREAMFPRYHADVIAGRPLVASGGEYAQDRVAMRRLLRRHLPDTDLRGMGTEELSCMIDQMQEVFQK